MDREMKRKSVEELKASGTWATMTLAERQARLDEEQLLMPEDLSDAETGAWLEQEIKFAELGVRLNVEDALPFRALVRAAVAGDEETYAAILRQFEERIGGKQAKEIVPPPALETARAYAEDVTHGIIVAGKFVKLAAKRFLTDLGRTDISFDTAAAQHIVDYVSRLGLELLPWQVFLLANLFGFKLDSGLRRFRYAFIIVAKKNGKTALSAALSLYMADPQGDREPYSCAYVAATTRYQSQSLCFKAAMRMRDENAHIKDATKKRKAMISWADSVFEPLAANSEKLNGLNIHFGVLDELGDHPTSDLHNVFTSATTGRKQPLIMSITTAGENREQIAYEQRNRAAQVLEGVLPGDSFFSYIAELDEGDNPEDESVWIKANPSLGVLVPVENIRDLAQQAAAIPSTKRSFLRYSFNIWPATSLTSWIDVNDLNAPGCAYLKSEDKNLSPRQRIQAAEENLKASTWRDLSKLSNKELAELSSNDTRRKCYAGLDLGHSNDLSALALLFPPNKPDGIWEILFRVWCPEEGIVRRSKEQRVPYDAWHRSGFLISTPGNTTDNSFIKGEILNLRKNYQILELGFDRTMAVDLTRALEMEGMKVTQVSQGFGLSPAIDRLGALIQSHRLCTFGQPVANWCLSNVSLAYGFKGDARMEKQKSREKIDAASAAATAMQIVLNQDTPVTSVGDSKAGLEAYKVRYI
jgi:phage terminase large subunit-like protein